MNKTALQAVEDRLMRSLIPFLLLGLAAAPALAKRTPADSGPGPSKTPTVLVLGDSLSAGYGLKRAEAYPALLSAKAAALGQPLRILNAGVSGDTTAGALRRLPGLLDRRIDVLLVELGINDIFRGVPVSQIEANLQKIIDLARAHSPRVRVIVAGMQLPQTSVDDSLTAFGQMYAELARRNSAELVPFLLAGVAGNPNLNLPDMIHPNASGQKILAANVWPVLERVLRRS
ncbi:MAG: arylesterase [Chthoniobacterales bacterium]